MVDDKAIEVIDEMQDKTLKERATLFWVTMFSASIGGFLGLISYIKDWL